MRNPVLLVGGAVFLAYVLGSRANRPTSAPRAETLRHQAERLWNDPKARKERAKHRAARRKEAEKLATKLKKSAGSTAKKAEKTIKKTADRLGR
ncbi:hypothetical protein [Microcella flavibacter]|uniref:hypothetical protein n=1 Tax=Microcella flavibacter TaxID=1804990 RepID=UPI001E5372B5|nr:hypothetical protein [Microcella flavibacter]